MYTNFSEYTSVVYEHYGQVLFDFPVFVLPLMYQCTDSAVACLSQGVSCRVAEGHEVVGRDSRGTGGGNRGEGRVPSLENV